MNLRRALWVIGLVLSFRVEASSSSLLPTGVLLTPKEMRDYVSLLEEREQHFLNTKNEKHESWQIKFNDIQARLQSFHKKMANYRLYYTAPKSAAIERLKVYLLSGASLLCGYLTKCAFQYVSGDAYNPSTGEILIQLVPMMATGFTGVIAAAIASGLNIGHGPFSPAYSQERKKDVANFKAKWLEMLSMYFTVPNLSRQDADLWEEILWLDFQISNQDFVDPSELEQKMSKFLIRWAEMIERELGQYFSKYALTLRQMNVKFLAVLQEGKMTPIDRIRMIIEMFYEWESIVRNNPRIYDLVEKDEMLIPSRGLLTSVKRTATGLREDLMLSDEAEPPSGLEVILSKLKFEYNDLEHITAYDAMLRFAKQEWGYLSESTILVDRIMAATSGLHFKTTYQYKSETKLAAAYTSLEIEVGEGDTQLKKKVEMFLSLGDRSKKLSDQHIKSLWTQLIAAIDGPQIENLRISDHQCSEGLKKVPQLNEQPPLSQ